MVSRGWGMGRNRERKKRFYSLLLVFNSLTPMCLGIIFFIFILLDSLITSWIYGLKCFFCLGKFLAIIFSKIYFCLFSVMCSSVAHMLKLTTCFMCHPCSFLFSILFVFCPSVWIFSIELSSYLPIFFWAMSSMQLKTKLISFVCIFLF